MDITIDVLLDRTKRYIKDEHIEIIKKAYEYANTKHKGQKRLTDDDYIKHPLNTAYILSTLDLDYETICGGLLHDVINMCDVTRDELVDLFGDGIANMVVAISKINKLSMNVHTESQANYYKKLLVSICEDPRVMLIKLADRLHNMRTLWALPEASRKEKAKETQDVLVPIAHRLGLNLIKSEMDDLSLKYLHPNIYEDIEQKLNSTKNERDSKVEEMKIELGEIFRNNNIKCEIKGRSKSIFGIYKKLSTGRAFNDIYDILALRVYVNTKEECYLVLGLIHARYKPISKRFKDFIAMPKENMYQSLHTSVYGVSGDLYEIQIRTYEMDEIAERGVAAHFAYKEKKDYSELEKNFFDKKLQFFREIIELNKEDVSEEEYINKVRDNILSDSMYVYTPKGDAVELPNGATPIDFAFKIHTEIGSKMVGALVNDTIVPLDYELKDGDIVKININKNSKGPSKEWYNMAKTSSTRSKIKSFFTKNEKDEYMKKGQDLLNKDLRKQKLGISDFLNHPNFKNMLMELKIDDIDDMYFNLGNYKYAPNTIINVVIKETRKKEDIMLEKITDNRVKKLSKNEILVENIEEIKVNIAECCNPVKGDSIVGYITKGNGITVHRSICHNIVDVDERIVDVKWNMELNKKYPASVIIECSKKDNFLTLLIKEASSLNISIQSINTTSTLDYNRYDLVVLVEDVDVLSKFIYVMEQLQDVIRIERINR